MEMKLPTTSRSFIEMQIGVVQEDVPLPLGLEIIKQNRLILLNYQTNKLVMVEGWVEPLKYKTATLFTSDKKPGTL